MCSSDLLLGEGRTIVLTTHFMDEAERLCSRLAIMESGGVIAEGSPRELIARHIEPQVVEVFGDGVAAWAAARVSAEPGRVELTGETAFCYSKEPAELLRSLENEPALRYLHRPANLEDVFLKLTGRDLRE